MATDDARARNLANWNERVEHHVASEMYDVAGLADGQRELTTVVAFDRPYLPPIEGQRVVHLQCHIGTDTLALSRLGAAGVTGYDFSAPALAAARDLFARAGTRGAFVEGELYDAAELLGEGRFDVVYTGVGALCWLPDVRGWAQVVASLLAPGGWLYLREGHPVLWALDYERDDDLLALDVPYFETAEPMTWDESETYADPDAVLSNSVTHEWNHGLGEIVQAVLDAGMTLELLVEHRVVDWQPFELFEPSPDVPGMWQLPAHLRDLLPLTYSLRARRPVGATPTQGSPTTTKPPE